MHLFISVVNYKCNLLYTYVTLNAHTNSYLHTLIRTSIHIDIHVYIYIYININHIHESAISRLAYMSTYTLAYN